MKKNLALLFAALLLSFIIAEIISRSKGKHLSYNERTGAGGYTSPFESGELGWVYCYRPYEKRYLIRDEFTESWTANNEGLKDKDISAKRGKRLLILGDSFTEGVGAPPDSSYPRILESLFKLHGDTSIEVINAGIGGSDIFFGYKLLTALEPKYKPDFVLLTCNTSDIEEHLTRGGFERFRKNNRVQYKKAPWFEPLYAHSLFVRLIVHDLFQYDYNFIPQENYSSVMREAEIGLAAAIDSFQSLCDLKKIRFAMVFHPFASELRDANSYEMKSLMERCRKRNILFVDALPCVAASGIGSDNWKDIYWESDGHFKSQGYEVLAQCVFEFIAAQGWLKQTVDSLSVMRNDGRISE